MASPTTVLHVCLLGQLPPPPTCSMCASSLDESRIEVRRRTGNTALLIRSIANDGRVKTFGGDVWVVRFATENSVWRRVARDMGNGSYIVDVPRDYNVQAWLQLWFTVLVPDYLESKWWIMSGHTSTSNRTFPSLPAQSFPDADQLQCRAASRGPITISAHMHTAPPTTRPCIGGEDGRWVYMNGSAPREVQPVIRHSFDSRYEWVPFGCERTQKHLNIGRCLAKAKLRVIIVGDSVSNGFALDICARLAGSANCSVWVSPRQPLPSGDIIISNVMSNPPRMGLRNMIDRAVEWVRALSVASKSIVVLQSGAHDVALPLPGQRDKISPLSAYRHHIRLLSHIVARVQAINPTIQFVWRQTAHQLLFEDRGAVSFCRRVYPGMNPLVIRALNEAARKALAPLGVTIWEEPALLTLSAPLGSFRDPVHHDACGAGSDRVDGSRGSKCGAIRRKGGEVRVHPTPSWTRTGGLSEAITDTFFDLVLGCK